VPNARSDRPLSLSKGRLRRIGRDMLDAELLERRPTCVGWLRSISPAFDVWK
jgi:hypothetical protein